ncbi:MAG: DegT/DnrJ/EryC1/StrS aminotransferase family protein [Flavobacteriales bacterium]|jgi:CDP-4-dehydro-6-deoxyglucose reductase, E1|nr:DegT/DnrJ/EryC1/StrS aminotransferase family protein [Flavobacteriales bacterium]
MIKLVNDTINNSDIDKLIEWLGTYPRLTKGELTTQLEEKWSKWLGTKNTVFCNSGSSANLLMLWALVEAGRITRDAKIVVPSVAWATDLAPVIQLGMTPILCDSNLEDLSVDLNHLETIFKETKPEVLLLVSVLGLVPKMGLIKALCDKYNVILLEDTCESMGSKWGGKKLGTFGLMSSFSTYFGHHISTIEGGFVSTDDEELYEILKSIRSHGWDRDASPKYSKQLRNKWKTSDFDALYTFYHSGFNLRSTDLQAFIGLGQIDKLDEICQKRNDNFKIYQEELSGISPMIQERGFTSNFAYPIIHEYRDAMVERLQKENIEVRPMICGSMGTQPFYVKKYGRKELPNVSQIDKYGFYVPNHPDLSKEDILKITNIIKDTSAERFVDPYLQTR